MTAEERAEYEERYGWTLDDDEAIMYTCRLPDDRQKVLVCYNDGDVGVDTFFSDPDYGCYFEDMGEMDGIIAWKPLPEPPKEANNA